MKLSAKQIKNIRVIYHDWHGLESIPETYIDGYQGGILDSLRILEISEECETAITMSNFDYHKLQKEKGKIR